MSLGPVQGRRGQPAAERIELPRSSLVLAFLITCICSSNWRALEIMATIAAAGLTLLFSMKPGAILTASSGWTGCPPAVRNRPSSPRTSWSLGGLTSFNCARSWMSRGLSPAPRALIWPSVAKVTLPRSGISMGAPSADNTGRPLDGDPAVARKRRSQGGAGLGHGALAEVAARRGCHGADSRGQLARLGHHRHGPVDRHLFAKPGRGDIGHVVGNDRLLLQDA